MRIKTDDSGEMCIQYGNEKEQKKREEKKNESQTVFAEKGQVYF